MLRMKKPSSKIKKDSALRKRAEALLKKQTGRLEDLSVASMRTLIHELGAHQVELEMQNEELRRAQIELEDSRRKYADLYDSAPVGYLTIDEKGNIIEANLTAATMLGAGKRALVNKRFPVFLEPEDLTIFEKHCAEVFRRRVHCAVEVRLRKSRSKGGFWALLDSVAVEDADGRAVSLRTALSNIDERKLGENALSAAHRQIQSIIDNTPALVYVFDREGRFVMANAAVAELLSQTPEQLLGKRRHAFMPKENADWHEANDRKVIEAGISQEFEEHSQLKDRSITWLTTKFPLRDARGKIYAIAGISADITERKQAEEALRASEARLSVFSDATFEGIVESEDGIILDCNEQFQVMLGRTKEDLRGARIADLVAPEDRDRVLENIRNNRDSVIEHAALRADGTRIFVEARGRNLSPGSGRRHTAIRDVTARKKSEEALIESEERMQLALRVSHSFTFDWLPATDTVVRSASCAGILRLSGDEAVRDTGKRYFERVHPDDRDSFLQILDGLRPGADSYVAEYRVLRGDGSIVVLEEIGKASFDEGGALARLTGVTTDITERKQAEAEIRTHIAELKAANEALSRFNFAAVHRELRMIELKKEVNECLRDASLPPRYPLEFVDENRQETDTGEGDAER